MSRYQFFYSCMLAPNDGEQFQAVFSNFLASVEFNTEIESMKSPESKIGLVSVYAGFLRNLSEAARHDSYIAAFERSFKKKKCMLLYIRPYQIFIGCQFENQDVNLTNGN